MVKMQTWFQVSFMTFYPLDNMSIILFLKLLHNNVLLNTTRDFSVHSELYLRSAVPVLDSPISALEFYRDWVATNLPVLIKGAVSNWPAIRKWDVQFLRYTLDLCISWSRSHTSSYS
jgi:hypothetical protein